MLIYVQITLCHSQSIKIFYYICMHVYLNFIVYDLIVWNILLLHVIKLFNTKIAETTQSLILSLLRNETE